MPTFIMFGKYSDQARKEISPDRTVWAFNLVREMGGRIKEMYALLGDTDLLMICDLPGIDEAMRVSAALGRHTGIAFSTSPAVTVDEFDKLLG